MQTFQQTAIDPFPALTQACSLRLDATRLTLLAFLVGERLGTVELADAIRMSRKTAWDYLTELESNGLVSHSGNGKATRWTCTEHGTRALTGISSDLANALRPHNETVTDTGRITVDA